MKAPLVKKKHFYQKKVITSDLQGKRTKIIFNTDK